MSGLVPAGDRGKLRPTETSSPVGPPLPCKPSTASLPEPVPSAWGALAWLLQQVTGGSSSFRAPSWKPVPLSPPCLGARSVLLLPQQLVLLQKQQPLPGFKGSPSSPHPDSE